MSHAVLRSHTQQNTLSSPDPVQSAVPLVLSSLDGQRLWFDLDLQSQTITSLSTAIGSVNGSVAVNCTNLTAVGPANGTVRRQAKEGRKGEKAGGEFRDLRMVT